MNKSLNRAEAGQELAKLLTHHQDKNAIVLGLPRGGVVTAKVVANELKLPLCLVVVKKISQPGDPEYAVGAVSESGELVRNESDRAVADESWWREAVDQKKKEAQARAAKLRGQCHGQDLNGKTAIIVDDGIATGFTMLAAVKEVKKHHPTKIVVAVPVAPREAVSELEKVVDEVVVMNVPELFIGSVGAYYQDFPQVEDDEVVELLKESHRDS